MALSSNLTEAELETLLEAARQGHERRVDPRYAFFTTVTLRPESSPRQAMSAFSREISSSGLGLLHAAPLAAGEAYEIDIRIEEVRVKKQGRAIWCRPVGDGWYLSGFRFV
jgi:hypothetical protein